MERLTRLREPAAIIALVGLAVHLVLVVLWAVRYPGPFGAALPSLAGLAVPPVLLVLLTALLALCWLPHPSPHARGLTVTGLVLTVALLVGTAASAIGTVTITPEGIDDGTAFLTWVVAPVTVAVISIVAQATLLRRPLAAPAAPPELEPAEPEPEPEPDPQQQPAWTPDAAVGTVWRRAGDATSQRPETSWESTGTSAGWGDTDPGPDASAHPTGRTEE